MLELREVIKHYHLGGEPVRAVDGVTLSVAPGEFLALYGRSGSGKSTLLNLIAGLCQPDSGTIVMDDRDLSQFSRTEHANYLLRDIGIIDNRIHLYAYASAWQNAALKLWRIKVRGAKRQLQPIFNELGLTDELNTRTFRLSTGQRQRVMIALALSTKPKLILADEPTGSLDTRLSRQVLGILRAVCQEHGTAVVLATHDIQALGYADTVKEMRDGRIDAYMPDPEFIHMAKDLKS